jgi:hypothetical protein
LLPDYFTGATGFTTVAAFAAGFAFVLLAAGFAGVAAFVAGASVFTGSFFVVELFVAALLANAKLKTQTETNTNFFMILFF